MTDARLLNILQAPVVSEKSNAARENNTFVFKVLKNATKDEIKAAVTLVFGTAPAAVRTLNVLGKTRRTNRGYGKRSDWKKAYVTFPAGTQIDVESTDQVNKESK